METYHGPTQAQSRAGAAGKALTLLVLVLVLAGCAQDQNPTTEAGTREPNRTMRHQEATVKHSKLGGLTGVITDVEDGRIPVEEDLDAGCRRDKAPVGPCSPKVWFSIEKSTRVLRERATGRRKPPTSRRARGSSAITPVTP